VALLPKPNSFRPNASRLDAFSDGVFAIAITILVLEIKVPDIQLENSTALWQSIGHQWPSFVAYALSFLVIGVFWSHHSDMFSYIRHRDHTLRLLNVFFLMFISLIPFSAKVLAHYMTGVASQPAIAIYVLVFALSAITFHFIWLYARRHPDALEEVGPEIITEIHRDYTFGLVMSIIAIVVSLLSGYVALTLIMINSIYFTVRVPERRKMARIDD
jgi:uncharacterized membrane protein